MSIVISKQKLIIPILKQTADGKSFSYLTPKLWNSLPNIAREADTLCQFKSRLRTYLFNLAHTLKIIHPYYSNQLNDY